MSDLDLARQLGFVAGDLSQRGYPFVGVVIRAARALLAVPAEEDGCRGCGGPLPPYPGRGRPRVWCSERCRRHRR